MGLDDTAVHSYCYTTDFRILSFVSRRQIRSISALVCDHSSCCWLVAVSSPIHSLAAAATFHPLLCVLCMAGCEEHIRYAQLTNTSLSPATPTPPTCSADSVEPSNSVLLATATAVQWRTQTEIA